MHLWIMIFFPLFPFYGLDHVDLEILLELKRLGSGLCNWLDLMAKRVGNSEGSTRTLYRVHMALI